MIFFQSGAEKEATGLAKAQALGKGPSAAQAQLAKNFADQQAMMTAQAGLVRGNPLAAARNAQLAGATLAASHGANAAHLRAQEQQAGQQMFQQQAQRETEAQNGIANGMMAMGSTALAAGVSSDIRGKNQIEDGAQRTDALLDAIQPYSFRYKDTQRNGEGERLGVMAQDVQRVAPEIVDRGKDGRLRLDGPGALSANLAASARLAERLDQAETQLAALGAPQAAERVDLYNRPGNQRDPSADLGQALTARARRARAEDARYRENSDFLRAHREFYGRPGTSDVSAEPEPGLLHGGNAIYPIDQDYASEDGRGSESNSRIRARAEQLTAARTGRR